MKRRKRRGKGGGAGKRKKNKGRYPARFISQNFNNTDVK